MVTPEEPESYLPDLETNPAAYPEDVAPVPQKATPSEPIPGTPEADAIKARERKTPGSSTPISGPTGN